MNIPEDPVIPWQHLHEGILDFFRILLLRKPQLPGDPLYVGVHHNARLIVDVSPDHVGSLSAHSRQGGQLLHGFRNSSPKLLH